MSLFDQLNKQKDNLSHTEKKVYDYVTNHIETLETYTISKIASSAGVSTSAVLRFCKSCGFTGFKEFQYAAIDYLHHNHTKESIDTIDTISDTYSSIMNQFKQMDRQLIDQLLKSIHSGHMIHIVGIHYSSLPAQYLSLGLQDLHIPSLYSHDYISTSHLTNLIKADDTLIMFSLNGNIDAYKKTLGALQYDMPKNSFLITGNRNATSCRYFSHTLVLPVNKQSIIEAESSFMIFVEIVLNMLQTNIPAN